ncbi:hypothetical protein EDB84DRAFT_1582700 [Lactarius hengduanensis]|nr:hypothetical protein EDB84DRAFT_1582700 [Lactarius hengduanensis]
MLEEGIMAFIRPTRPEYALDNFLSCRLLSGILLPCFYKFYSHSDTVREVPSTCRSIANAISNSSQLFYPSEDSTQYDADIEHAGVSSSQVSACSVEPMLASLYLRILGSTRTPFAVKGGGHAFNPGIELNNVTGTVDAGSGVTLDQVYAALDSSGLNIIGGRSPGVGIAGLTLGSGYAFTSNQYELTIDNMAGYYELVLPNGTITNVTESNKIYGSHFRQGGGNNFGIVTKFTYKTVPQGQYGSFIVLLRNANRHNAFQNNRDKATYKERPSVTSVASPLLSPFFPLLSLSLYTHISYRESPLLFPNIPASTSVLVPIFELLSVRPTSIWGGTLNYNVDQLDLVKEAVLKFQQKNDTKAALNVPVIYTPAGVISAAIVFLQCSHTRAGYFR